MAKKKNAKVSIDKTCETCAFFDKPTCYCRKKAEQTNRLMYACDYFRTPEEWHKECEERRKERLRKEEQRLNFILTALYISATSTMQLEQKPRTGFTFKQLGS